MKKRKYFGLDMEIIEFDTEDVITESQGSDAGNDTGGDASNDDDF